MDEPRNMEESIWKRIVAHPFITILAFFGVISIGLSCALVYLLIRKTTIICLTSECIKTASVILTSMNANMDPCEDFYEYACGNWIKEHPIPDDAPSVSNFENLGQGLELALKGLLERKNVEGLDGEAVRKARAFYRLCLNETAIMNTWREAFDDAVEKFGGWPSLEQSDDKPRIPIEQMYGVMVAKFKCDSLFKATVQPDDKNSKQNILLIDQPALNLFARDFYILPETQEERLAYKTLIRDVLLLLQARVEAYNRDFDEILQFETDLANITLSDDLRHDISELYNKMTIEQMRKEFPNFNWLLFFNTIFQNIGSSNDKMIVINDTTEIVIYGLQFIKKLDKLLPKYDKRIITNYLAWCWFFKTMLRDLPDPFALTMFKFYKSLNLMQVPKMRWHSCVTRINNLMPMAISSIYIRKHFDNEAKKQVEEMIDLIMAAFVDMLQTEDWLTERAKEFAKEKVDAMSKKIGYPNYLDDSKLVDNDYKDYIVYDNNYYKTKFQFYQMYQKDVLERIVEKVDRERWVAGAALVNAFYSPNTNEIIFPAGILQPVFYHKNFPRSMNFGGIGVVIGHEITHGFDDRGRLYDKYGNIRQWWDNATIEKFETKTKCIEDQYSAFVLEQIGMKVNGRSTKGENIADNGGLKQAYKAYKEYVRKHPQYSLLPGVNLTHDQLFFLNYAQIWCGAMNDKEAVRKLRTSEHSPGPIRVKGPLSNSEDFAKAYNCPSGSPMNPEHKCRVW
ncbi:Neprilysin-2 [Acanthocheilonema viteae]